jgi:murein DD-endopeptidase MepM/ murein hydrolase activator NlpD
VLDVSAASWSVKRGNLIGYTGDAGYSEALHLRYQIARLSDGAQLCPTTELGFVDGGWLSR